jgi:hypothetical protein
VFSRAYPGSLRKGALARAELSDAQCRFKGAFERNISLLQDFDSDGECVNIFSCVVERARLARTLAAERL